MRPKYSIGVIALALALVAPSSFGNTCAPIIWTPGGDPLYRFNESNEAGFIDQTGKIVVPAILGSTEGHFQDGLLNITGFDGVYLDTTGKRAFETKLFRGWDFSEGLAVAMAESGGKWGYINTKGEFAISPRFASSQRDYVWPFQDGLAKIEVGGRFGFIDHSGEFVIPPTFLEADSFHGGMARVIVDGLCLHLRERESSCGEGTYLLPKGFVILTFVLCKYTFIDKTGKVITDQRYDRALAFSEGLAAVGTGGLWGFIDKTGKLVIPPRFQAASDFSDGLAAVSENGLFGYIDSTGNYVIHPAFKYQIVGPFVDGLALVGNPRSEMFFIDRHGHQAFPRKFVIASPFYMGLAHVKFITGEAEDQDPFAGTFGYINPQGKIIFTYKVGGRESRTLRRLGAAEKKSDK
jgi:hypothetical protein